MLRRGGFRPPVLRHPPDIPIRWALFDAAVGIHGFGTENTVYVDSRPSCSDVIPAGRVIGLYLVGRVSEYQESECNFESFPRMVCVAIC